jgi:hypothetical protein
MTTLASILDPATSVLQIAPICQAVQSDSFLDELAFNNGISMDALFAMPDNQLFALVKSMSLKRLHPARFAEDELPRGADTLCLTCLEYGACLDWVLDTAEELCEKHPSWNKNIVIVFIADKVLRGEYDHNTPIHQIQHEVNQL